MMIYLMGLMALLLSGCGKGPTVHVKGEIKPVEVTHRVVLDTDALESYYREVCQAEHTDPAAVELCVANGVKKFLDLFTKVEKK